MNNEKKTYRRRIYPAYTSLQTPEAAQLDQRRLEVNARALLARLSDWLPEDRRAVCLDVACGSGGLLFALRHAGYTNLSGVDISSQQTKLAQQICPAVENGDAIEYLKRHPNQFDFITALDIIEHFDKDEVFGFLDALYIALKPGGSVIIQTPNADSPWFTALRYGDITHETAFTPGSLELVTKISGFEDFEARECRPYMHGMKSLLRKIIWYIIRGALIGWNVAETGSFGSRIHTRVFIAKAEKPA